MTTFHIDVTGKLLRATSNPDVDIAGATFKTEVPPVSGRQVWNFGLGAWGEVPAAEPAPLDAEELYEILVTKGLVDETDRPRPKPQKV